MREIRNCAIRNQANTMKIRIKWRRKPMDLANTRIPRSMLNVSRSSSCCCKNLFPLLFLFFWPDVWGKPIISIFSTWSWNKKDFGVYSIRKSFETCLYQFQRLIYIISKIETSNLPNIPTSGSDMVVISVSATAVGRIEIGFWPLPIVSYNLSRRLLLFPS